MRSADRNVVPEILEPGDPHAGDEARYDPGSLDNARRCGFDPEPEGFAAADRAFHRIYLDILAGRRSWGNPDLPRLVETLGLSSGRTHDRRPRRIAERDVPDEVLVDIAEDFAPDLGLVIERITGGPAPAPLGAWAALAFLGIAVDGCRPLDLWVDEEPDRALVRSARVVDASAPGLYQDGVSLLPTAPGAAPDQGPRGVYVARAYRIGEGWAWSALVELPGPPDPRVVLRRLDLELLRTRRHERRATFEDMLRARPEVLYRTCLEATTRNTPA